MSFGGGFHTNSHSTFATPQSSGAFGMPSAFGSSPVTLSTFALSRQLFVQATGGFGQTAGSTFFGSTPASPNTGGSIFGGNTNPQLFGSFGQQNKGFGSSSAVVPFGGSGSTFTMQTGPTGNSADGSQGTYGRAFERTPDAVDTASSGQKAYLMTIVAMKDFLGSQPEMLRAADYKKGHRRSSGQVQTLGSSAGVFGGGGFGGSSTPSGSSSPFGGGFRGSTGFGGSSTGIFGQSTPQPSVGIGPSFSQAGSTFGQAASSGGVGSTFGTTGSSVFGGSAGFGQQSSSSLFGSQQQARSSIFGNQPTSGFGSAALGQRASGGAGLFGQSSTSVFGARSSPAVGGGGFASSGGLFSQQSSGGLFGAQSSGAFASRPASSGSIFGSFSSGSSIFGQQSSASIFGGFGQSASPIASPSPLFQSSSQPRSLFGQQKPSAASGPAPGPVPSSHQQQGQQLGYFVAEAPKSAAAVRPSGLPDWNNMSSSMAQILQQGLSTAQSKVGSTLSDKSDSTKGNPRYIPVKVKFPKEDIQEEKSMHSKFQMDWTSFSLAKPMQMSLADEIKATIEEYEKSVPRSESQDALCEVAQPPSGSQPHPESPACVAEENVPLNYAEMLKLLPTLENSEYYIYPSIDELEQMIEQKGGEALKAVSDVEIGRTDFGKVTFLAPVNLEKLNINAALTIERGRVDPGTQSNPLTGVPVAITLFKVFSKDKGMSGFLGGGRDLDLEIERLRKYTRKFNGDFVSYDRYGTWKFNVKTLLSSSHFMECMCQVDTLK